MEVEYTHYKEITNSRSEKGNNSGKPWKQAIWPLSDLEVDISWMHLSLWHHKTTLRQFHAQNYEIAELSAPQLFFYNQGTNNTREIVG